MSNSDKTVNNINNIDAIRGNESNTMTAINMNEAQNSSKSDDATLKHSTSTALGRIKDVPSHFDQPNEIRDFQQIRTTICNEVKEASDRLQDTSCSKLGVCYKENFNMDMSMGSESESQSQSKMIEHSIFSSANDTDNNSRQDNDQWITRLTSLDDPLDSTHAGTFENETPPATPEAITTSATEPTISSTTAGSPSQVSTPNDAEGDTGTTSQRPNRFFLFCSIRFSTIILETVWLISPIIFFVCLLFPCPTWLFFAYLTCVFIAAYARSFFLRRLLSIEHNHSMKRIVANLIRRECTEIINLQLTECNGNDIEDQQNKDEVRRQDKFVKDTYESVTASKKLVFSKQLLPQQTKAPRLKNRFYRKFKKQVTETDNLVVVTSTSNVTTTVSDAGSNDTGTTRDLESGQPQEVHEIGCDNDDTKLKEDTRVDREESSAVEEDEIYDIGEGCDICMSCFEVGEIVTWSQNPACGHMFHENCIVEWLCGTQRKLTCPCCRNDYYYEVNNETKKRGGLGWIGTNYIVHNDSGIINDGNTSANANTITNSENRAIVTTE